MILRFQKGETLSVRSNKIMILPYEINISQRDPLLMKQAVSNETLHPFHEFKGEFRPQRGGISTAVINFQARSRP